MTSQQLPASLCWGAVLLDCTSGEPDIWPTVFVSVPEQTVRDSSHSKPGTEVVHRDLRDVFCSSIISGFLFRYNIWWFSNPRCQITHINLPNPKPNPNPDQKFVVAVLQSYDDRQHFPLSKNVLTFLAICLFWSSLSSRYKKTHTHRMIIISLCEGIHCHSHFMNHFQFPRPVTLQDRRH